MLSDVQFVVEGVPIYAHKVWVLVQVFHCILSNISGVPLDLVLTVSVFSKFAHWRIYGEQVNNVLISSWFSSTFSN